MKNNIISPAYHRLMTEKFTAVSTYNKLRSEARSEILAADISAEEKSSLLGRIQNLRFGDRAETDTMFKDIDAFIDTVSQKREKGDKALVHWQGVMLHVLTWYGLSKEEIGAFRKQDYNLKEETIFVRGEWIKVTPKCVAAADELAHVSHTEVNLEEYRTTRSRQSNEYLFAFTKSEAITANGIGNIAKKFAKQIGTHYTLHNTQANRTCTLCWEAIQSGEKKEEVFARLLRNPEEKFRFDPFFEVWAEHCYFSPIRG